MNEGIRDKIYDFFKSLKTEINVNCYADIMGEYFVDSDMAIELRKFGFDEYCMACYVKEDNYELKICPFGINAACYNSQKNGEYGLSAPLLQQAIDWLFDNKGIRIDVSQILNGTDDWHYAIDLKWRYYEGTRDEARRAAIKEAIIILEKNNK